jgi:outer membrane protein OmpA-like peptidoglycan-associated protein
MTFIMKPRYTTIAAVAAVGLVAAACGTYMPRLASITVRPDTTLSAGSSHQFIAEGRDTRGAVFTIVPTWSVEAMGGTVSKTGMFTAGSVPGTFTRTVRASEDGISGEASVTVTTPSAPGLSTITVTPSGSDTIPATATRWFMATGTDARGYTVAPFTPTWSVVAGGGAINSAGLFTAGTVPGTYRNTIRASSGAAVGYATVTVASTATSLETMQETVRFAYDKSDLTADTRAALDSKVLVFRTNPAMRILIVGHTDARGTGEYNLALGTRRAEAVRDYLVAQGVASNRIILQTRGETQPVAWGGSESGMAQNRRGTFIVLVTEQ